MASIDAVISNINIPLSTFFNRNWIKAKIYFIRARLKFQIFAFTAFYQFSRSNARTCKSQLPINFTTSCISSPTSTGSRNIVNFGAWILVLYFERIPTRHFYHAQFIQRKIQRIKRKLTPKFLALDAFIVNYHGVRRVYTESTVSWSLCYIYPYLRTSLMNNTWSISCYRDFTRKKVSEMREKSV